MEETKCITASLEVRNFSYITTEKCHLKFYVNSLNESYWCLYITEHDESSISVNLACDVLKDERPITLDFEISLLNDSGSVISKEKKVNVEFSTQCKNIYPVYLKHGKNLPGQIKFKNDTATIKCRLWNFKKTLSFPIFYSAWSQVGIQKTTFDWKIANFKKLKCNGQKRTHEIYNGGDLPQFTVELFLQGNTANQADVCLDVRQYKKNIPFVKTAWAVSVMDPEKNVVKFIKFCPKMVPSSTFHAPTLLTKEEFASMRDKILSNNTLNLVFDVTFSTGVVLNALESTSFLPEQDLLPQESYCPEDASIPFNASSAALQADLLFLYREQTLSDFEFRTGGQTFKVHKNILCARSPVFKAMFSGEMAEASGKELDVPDIDPTTLEFLLMFMYTGSIDTMKCDSAIKIYYAADKYEMLPLKKICSEFLASHVSEDNLCEILLLADMHQDSELLSSVNEYIICNDQEVIQSKKWEEFLLSHPLLAAKVMRTVLQKTRYSGKRKSDRKKGN